MFEVRHDGASASAWLSALVIAGCLTACADTEAATREVEAASRVDRMADDEDEAAARRGRKERRKRRAEELEATSGDSPATAPGVDRPASGPLPIGEGPAWLVEADASWGLEFVHVGGDTTDKHLPQIMGSGGAFLDYDLDGDQDLYLIHGGPDPERPSRGSESANQLFRNEEGTRFTDVTEGSGLGGDSYGHGAAVGDLDNDGYPDLYLSAHGPDQLFRNEAGERFADVSPAAGIRNVEGMSASAIFFDYDRDGFLDLYVCQYVDYLTARRCFDTADRHDYCGPSAFDPLRDRLFHNEGDGTFVDVSRASGVGNAAAAGLGVVSVDFSEDGWPDLYVANDGYQNFLWVNQTDGTFLDDAVILGVAFNQHGEAEAGMGVIAGDFDMDARVDLFMTHLRRETNTLYRNLGAESGFVDFTAKWGLAAPSRNLTGFGTLAFDLELDGDLDIFAVNGRVLGGEVFEGAPVPKAWEPYAEPNLCFLNKGNGTFSTAGDELRAFVDPTEVSRGLLSADVDLDGDVDLVVTNIDGPARLYLNEAPRQGSWLRVEAMDGKRFGLGAELELELGKRRLTHTVARTCGYLTSHDPAAHFGIPSAWKTEPMALSVRWVDGTRERFEVPGLDRTLVIERGHGEVIQ